MWLHPTWMCLRQARFLPWEFWIVLFLQVGHCRQKQLFVSAVWWSLRCRELFCHLSSLRFPLQSAPRCLLCGQAWSQHTENVLTIREYPQPLCCQEVFCGLWPVSILTHLRWNGIWSPEAPWFLPQPFCFARASDAEPFVCIHTRNHNFPHTWWLSYSQYLPCGCKPCLKSDGRAIQLWRWNQGQ